MLFGSGCALICPNKHNNQASAYGYTPFDPLPVLISTNLHGSNILAALPDETMRLAIGELTDGGNVTYGPAKLGYSGNQYVVVLDYIKYNTRSFRVAKNQKGPRLLLYLSDEYPTNAPASPFFEMITGGTNNYDSESEFVVPVYVGVGLRLTANLTVNSGTVDLGNLFSIGAAAQAKKVTGTLVIQTLGISGAGITSSIPLPSEINTTTILNAIMALGTIKSKIYDQTTSISPRVVAVYNNLDERPEVVRALISAVLRQPIELKASP